MPIEHGRKVVVTGASSGIGRASALRLDQSGFRVLAGVRNAADAGALAATASNRFTTFEMDVTDPKAIARAVQTVNDVSSDAGLHGLVSNAGISLGGPLEITSLESLRQCLEVNVVGTVALIQAFLPLLRNGHGRIVVIGSISGRLPSPMLSYYSASKAALAAIADCLRVELRPWSIPVSLIEPGAVKTPMWDKGLREADAWMAAPPAGADLYMGAARKARAVIGQRAQKGIAADRVATAVVHALTSSRPRSRYLVGADARIQSAIRLAPDRVRDLILARVLGLDR
ncbi:MAG TPA: SDR family NAD(P)-dependent oxidoreductase [Candidatus Dormibacteraeota bacterium]|nr:SDR family NAD(P)-dependent oxidoreductase [Candidatus Dormibacteraeota bacterium]